VKHPSFDLSCVVAFSIYFLFFVSPMMSDNLSTHSKSITSSTSKFFGKALVKTDEDEEIPIEEYEDVRIELFATSHNLVNFFSPCLCSVFLTFLSSSTLDIRLNESTRNWTATIV
jgi:hypothetical protein